MTLIVIVTQITPNDSLGTLVFWCQRYWWIINRVMPNGDAK